LPILGQSSAVIEVSYCDFLADHVQTASLEIAPRADLHLPGFSGKRSPQALGKEDLL
jgi:hypothetical protein